MGVAFSRALFADSISAALRLSPFVVEVRGGKIHLLHPSAPGGPRSKAYWVAGARAAAICDSSEALKNEGYLFLVSSLQKVLPCRAPVAWLFTPRFTSFEPSQQQYTHHGSLWHTFVVISEQSE